MTDALRDIAEQILTECADPASRREMSLGYITMLLRRGLAAPQAPAADVPLVRCGEVVGNPVVTDLTHRCVLLEGHEGQHLARYRNGRIVTWGAAALSSDAAPQAVPFGMPGHCYDIDGGWAHDPGTCAAVECRHYACCGYPPVADASAAPEGER